MNTSQLKQTARQYYQQKDFENAKKTYYRIIQIDPNDATIHGNLAQVYYQQKNYNACFISCCRAIQLDQKYKKIYYRRAHCSKELNNYYQCYVDARSFLELEKDAKQAIQQMKKLAKDMKIKMNEDTTKQKKILLFKKTNPQISKQILEIQNKINIDGICIEKLQQYLRIVQQQKTRFYGLIGKQLTDNLSTIQRIEKKIYQKLLNLQVPVKKIEILDILNPQKDQMVAFLKNKIELYEKGNFYEQAILYLRALNKLQKNDNILYRIQRLKQQFLSKLEQEQRLRKQQEQRTQKLTTAKTEQQLDITVNQNNPQSKLQIDQLQNKNKVHIQKQSSIDDQLNKQIQNHQKPSQNQKLEDSDNQSNKNLITNLNQTSNQQKQQKSQKVFNKEAESTQQSSQIKVNQSNDNIALKQCKQLSAKEEHLQNDKNCSTQENPQKYKIQQLIIKVNKFKQFSDFYKLFCELRQSKQNNLQKLKLLHQISNLKCFKMLISGMSVQQKNCISECIQDILCLEAKQLKQLYKI